MYHTKGEIATSCSDRDGDILLGIDLLALESHDELEEILEEAVLPLAPECHPAHALGELLCVYLLSAGW